MNIDNISTSLVKALSPTTAPLVVGGSGSGGNDIYNSLNITTTSGGGNDDDGDEYEYYNFNLSKILPPSAPPLTLQDTYYRGVKMLYGLGM